jgi:hypothetical protein
MAKSHFEAQQYEAAETGMRRALAVTETRQDSAESVAFCLYELGWLLYFDGKYQEAEPSEAMELRNRAGRLFEEAEKKSRLSE